MNVFVVRTENDRRFLEYVEWCVFYLVPGFVPPFDRRCLYFDAVHVAIEATNVNEPLARGTAARTYDYIGQSNFTRWFSSFRVQNGKIV